MGGDERMELAIKNVSAGYGRIQVLWDVSLEVKQGKLTALVGPNGAGKSTLLKVITGFLKPYSGSIELDGINLTYLKPHMIKKLGISMVPEGRRLFPNLTVKENLTMGAYFLKEKHVINEQMEFIFSIFPVLKERLNQTAKSLSGGEAQMLAIARALISYPKILIIDEPSLGLSPKMVSLIFEKLMELKNRGTTLLIVDQYVDKVLSIADWAYVMENGKIVMSGEGLELLKTDMLKKFYLGIG